MSFFGMGGMEIMVIMVVALIIFGPGKLPELGSQVGKAVRDFRRMTNDMTSEFNESTSDIRSTMDEMKGAVAQVEQETKTLANSIPATFEGAAAAAKSNGTATATTTAPLPAPTRQDPLADLEGLDLDSDDASSKSSPTS